MVDVIKDERNWLVNLTFIKDDCPFLRYPANYHGCYLLENGEKPCTLENCPRRVVKRKEEEK